METQEMFPGKESGIERDSHKISSFVHVLNNEEEFLLNNNGIIISSNLEAVNVTGYEEFEIIGRHISIFYPSLEFEQSKIDLENAIRMGSLVTAGPRLKKRAVQFWAWMKVIYLHPTNSVEPTFRVILKDATHKALSKERSSTLREEYLALLNNGYVGSFKFRIDNFIMQSCNLKALEILGGTENPTQPLNQFFSSSEAFEKFIALLLKERRVDGFKFHIKKNSKQDTWAIIHAHYFESHGFVEGVLLDITDQHKQMLELERVNKELDSFIYHASHDLRSPLTSVMGLASLGLKEHTPKEIHAYLKMIQNCTRHLDNLLKDLMSVSYNNQPTDNQELFSFEIEVSSIIKGIEGQSVPLLVTTEISQPTDFTTDPMRMRIILRNIIDNAFKYYNPDLDQPALHLSIHTDHLYCTIQLKDNGIGIPNVFKPRIFEMFFRGTVRSSGTGLGLYIVKTMVEKLNGKISYISSINSGTTFFITIPNQKLPSPIMNKSNILNHSFHITNRQIELVENSWAHILIHAQDAGELFFDKLFSANTNTLMVSQSSPDLQARSQKLIAIITFAVHRVSNLDELINETNKPTYHVQRNLDDIRIYENVAIAFMWMLEKTLENRWNQEMKDAWQLLYIGLSKLIIDAALSEK